MDLKSLESLMQTSPETLAQTQFDALKEHVLSVLYAAIDKINKDKLVGANSASFMCYHSPAGDCMGDTSNPINFGYSDDEPCLSFGDIVDKMHALSLSIKK